MKLDDRRLRATVMAMAGLVVLGTVAGAVLSTAEALEERRSAAAAMDLRMASMTVAAADVLAAHGAELPVSNLATSVAELSGNHDGALHALDPADAERARDLLAEIAGCGVVLLDPGDNGRVVHSHQELHDLLDTAAKASSADAGRAERRAVVAVLGAVVAVSFGIWRLIRSRHRSEQHRARAEAQARAGRRLESMINDSPDIFLVVDLDGAITYRSASADRLLGSGPCRVEDLIGLANESGRASLREHLRRSDAGGASEVFALTDAGQQTLWFELRVTDLTQDDLVDGYLVTARDITGEVTLREELKRAANTDLLTGLPNRRVLDAAIEEAKTIARDRATNVAIVTLDIDGFKAINDTLGHSAGDELLTRVAARLGRATRRDESLLRLGGDEFVLIIPSVDSAATAQLSAQRLLGVLDEPFQIGDRTEHVRTSIGVAVTSDPNHVDALLSEADIAMYEAKRQGGDKVILYEPALNSTASRATQITRALRVADYDNEFCLVYQPIVSADTARVVGLEALLRWTSPELGSVTPDEFIPVAEASGEICGIGKWVLDAVCCQLSTWIAAGIDPAITVSFNVSPRQLAEQHYVASVIATAKSWSVAPQRLVVEVTESTALDHTGLAIARLEQLRHAGLRVSIDDFGSGYSNLGQLLTVPYDIIKIDRSLLLTLTAMREQAGGDASEPCAIMEAIVSIAGILSAPVVCEGVETEEQRVSLRASGISLIQGYLTGRPVPAAIISAQLFPDADVVTALA